MKDKQVVFDTVIEKFGNQGEKTGWRYIIIPPAIALQLYPGNKKSFRVMGSIDMHEIEKTALIPMGEGAFIIPLNATIRKAIDKKEGQKVTVKIKRDHGELLLDADLVDCLEEDASAKKYFYTMAPSHQHYFSKWIASAKTEATKAKRIAMTLDAMIKKIDYGTMLREAKK